jgi:hypothetical protein
LLINLGLNIPKTAALFLINLLTVKYCDTNSSDENSVVSNFKRKELTELLKKIQENNCATDFKVEVCTKQGGKCVIQSDIAFYIITSILILFGIGWLFAIRKRVRYLENVPNEDWRVSINKKNEIADEEENEQERDQED